MLNSVHCLSWDKDHHLTVPLEMDEVQGPADVMKGIPLNVATPLSSVKRCCTVETHTITYMQVLIQNL